MSKKEKIKSEGNSKLIAFFKDERTRFVFGLSILLFVLYLFLALVSFFFTGAADQNLLDITTDRTELRPNIQNWTGVNGAKISNFLINKGFGVSVFFALYFFLILGLRFIRVRIASIWKSFLYSSFGLIWFSLFFSFFFQRLYQDTFIYLGGEHGYYMNEWLQINFGIPGTFLLLLATMLIFCLFAFDNTIVLLKKIFTKKQTSENLDNIVSEELSEENNIKIEDVLEETQETSWIIQPEEETLQNVPEVQNFEIILPQEEEVSIAASTEKEDEDFASMEIISNREEEYNALSELGEYDPTLDLSTYRYPSIDILKEYTAAEMQVNLEEQNANKNKILSTLESFGIKIATIKATVGPTITLYEIQPESGVRISKIKNLEDDIALSLSALGIRIIAPIPGKGTIGIEVPNRDPQTVSMRSVITSKKFQEAKFDLPIALGKTITNDTFVFDLCKMPHLLVAGATGQGKSVGLNAIITSLLYKKHPSQLKFVLIDPKKVEFNIYSEIERHFLAKLPDEEEPVITDVTKVVQTLNSLTKEMDERYDLLKKAHARNIKEYNEKFIKRRLNPEKGHRFMPYIVVIIDEFGDLIMTAGKEVELPIARIAQLARAIGIHMIIATQRPSVSIITGVIKANFPARIAFRVSAMVDSRTILDASGANQLVGKGDLLFSQGSDLTRVQCAFVDTPEVEKIVEFIGNQRGYPTAFELPEYVPEDNGKDSGGDMDTSKLDSMFEDAARIIVIHQQGSTSFLQRKFEIGYNRAGRIMDQLEKFGIVGAARGSKPRDVLIQSETHLNQILEALR